MEVQEISIDKLTPYGRKLRKNDSAVARMMASIKEYGCKVPLLARHRGDEIELVDGDLRLKAARKLRLLTVPVIFCDEWTETQVKGFRLLVDRSATWSTWDEDMLTLELEDLSKLDFDLSLTGFAPFEVDELLFPATVEPKGDKTPDGPETAVTLSGDLWRLGKHRVLCGDSTLPEAVALLLGEGRPKLMVTDPPYGINYDPNWRERAGLGEQRQTGLVQNDDQVDWTAAYKLFEGDVIYLWHAGVHAGEVSANLEACGFCIRAQIIWVKQNSALSRGDFSWRHEPCYYAVRKGKSSNWSGDRKQTTVWEVPNLNPFGGSHEEATGHSAQKPTELYRRPILNNTRQGEIVYDPFLGSGTTLEAAQLTDRLCYGMEIDPRYVDMIVKRWQTLTGGKATLEADGRTFEDVTEQRQKTLELQTCPD